MEADDNLKSDLLLHCVCFVLLFPLATILSEFLPSFDCVFPCHWIHRGKEWQAGRRICRQASTQAGKQAGRQAGRKASRQAGKQAGRQAGRRASRRAGGQNEHYLICSNNDERQRCCGWGKENNCKWVTAVVRKQWRNALRHGLVLVN